MLAPVLITAATSTPISVEEAKAHLRVDGTGEDDLITIYVAAATAYLDGYSGVLGRALVTQTWRQDYDCFTDKLRLPLPPVASVTSVTYYDTLNASTTLATSVYALQIDAAGPHIALKPGQVFPGSYTRTDAVSVTYVTGTAAADVPAPIRAALLLMVGDLYANRETAQVGSVASRIPMSMTVAALIEPYRRNTP